MEFHFLDGRRAVCPWGRQGNKPPDVLKGILFKDLLQHEETQQRWSVLGGGLGCRTEVWSEIFSHWNQRSTNGRVLEWENA